MRKNYSNSKGCVFNTHEHNHVLEVSHKIHVGIKKFQEYVSYSACFTCLPVGASLVQLAHSSDVQFALGWRRKSNTKYLVLSISRSAGLLRTIQHSRPRWSSGYHTRLWIRGSRVRSRLGSMNFFRA